MSYVAQKMGFGVHLYCADYKHSVPYGTRGVNYPYSMRMHPDLRFDES